jgi:nucleotide-binding universal stress UspA family protein
MISTAARGGINGLPGARWRSKAMPQIKKILFPVDFSESCFAAARYVEFLAGQFEAEVKLLHVVGMGEHSLAEELLPERRAQLNAFLADELRYFTTSRICVIGDPADQIVEAAQRWSPDLVAMPTHGLGTFRRLLIGSVTAKVLSDLECPVWTGAHLETPKPLESIHCRRILCAVDLGDRSPKVLEYADWLAKEHRAMLAVAHATPQLNGAYYGYGLEQEFAESMASQACKRIDELQEKTGAVIDQMFVNSDGAASLVSCAAQQYNADLVVMGRHSKSGLAGFLRPNAYAILRDSSCPAISI